MCNRRWTREGYASSTEQVAMAGSRQRQGRQPRTLPAEVYPIVKTKISMA